VIVVDGSHEDPVLAGQADGGHLDFLIVQLLLEQVAGFRGAFPLHAGPRGPAPSDFAVRPCESSGPQQGSCGHSGGTGLCSPDN